GVRRAHMDFNDSSEEAAYRTTVRDWMAVAAPPFSSDEPGESEQDFVRRARGWQARKFAAGYVGITWPRQVGGQGESAIRQIIFSQEEARYPLALTPFQVGMGMCLPTLYTYASADVVRQLLPSAMRGEKIWCQLFSEP